MFNWFKKARSIRGKVPPAAVSIESGSSSISNGDFLNGSEVCKNRGNQFLSQGKLAEATECYLKAIAINPNFSEAYLNLGFALNEQKLYEDAERALKQAILLNPTLSDAHYLIGTIALQAGKLNLAIESFNIALALKPDFEIVYRDLCHALFQSGRIENAKSVIEKGLALNSQFAEFHYFRGNLFYHEKQMEQAINCYQKALLLQPDFLQVHTNMGNVLMQMGMVNQAIDSYEKALAIDPDLIEAESCLLFIRAYHSNASPELYLAAAKRYGSKVAKNAKPYTNWSTYSSGKGLMPLRVGLVSGDFNNHPVAFFLERALAHLNPDRVQLVAYPTSSQEDEITARLKPHFSAWTPIANFNDEAAARQIQADGIQVLIDLAGHTTHNRLSMFAWKPAPVQVNWLGFLASTGVSAIDYLLADPISVLQSHQNHFTEAIYYLPDTVNCMTPPKDSPTLAITAPPALRNGYVTFGCFQNLTKVNDEVLTLWGSIFQALPNARLRLQIKQLEYKEVREDFQKRLTRVGITPEKVRFGRLIASREAYLAIHNEVDIILDTFPCPGITTTCEALWMGVPTVTLAGDTLLSRQGASLLSCAGLTDWIAHDKTEYVARACAHASDISHLARLRSELRQQVLRSPLFDAPRFAKNLEDALHKMWQKKMGTEDK